METTTSVADIERLLADEPEALARLREELAGKPGSKEGGNNPHGLGGKAGKTIIDDANNVSVIKEPDLFDPPPTQAPKPKRQTQHGSRRDYTLTRLKKNSPELFEEVKSNRLKIELAGLLTPNSSQRGARLKRNPR